MAFPGVIELAGLDGSDGFALHSVSAYDYTGRSVSTAGDVNGDGVSDFLIGAHYARGLAGSTYVVYGGSQVGNDGVVELSSLNGTNGFVIHGENADDWSGYSVSSAGDVNDDGVDDVLIGAYQADPGGQSNAGITYIVYGGSQVGINGVLELSSLNGINGFALHGENASRYSGYSVSAAGDVNGDGIDDILVGEYRADSEGRGFAGSTYVVYGSSQVGSNGVVELSSLNGTNGFVLHGVKAYDYSGQSVSAAGDVNADGIGDLLIGAESSTYVVYGGPQVGGGGVVELSSLDGSNGFVIHHAKSVINTFVSAAGDLNGDGVSDVLIGVRAASPGGRTRAGSTYVVYGGSQVGGSGVVGASTLDGSNGFVIHGVNADDGSGISVSAAGDVNGDGIDDVLIGAPFSQARAGTTYVVYGGSQVGRSGVLELSSLNGTNGLVLRGANAGDRSGMSVSTAGDVNLDGVDDMLIGADLGDPEGRTFAGVVYVVYGAALRLLRNKLTLSQGDVHHVTTDNLHGINPKINSDQLIFTVRQVTHGQFEWVNVSGTAIMTFTQTDINTDRVRFVHDDTKNAPSYVVSLTDGQRLITDKPADITFNFSPVLTHHRLYVNQGETHVLNQDDVLIEDDNFSSELAYTFSEVTQGHFEWVNSSSAVLSTFTQANVNTGQVQFVHADSIYPPTYQLMISDGLVFLPSVSAVVDFNLAPTWLTNQLTINEGEYRILTTEDLLAEDGDNLAVELVYTVSQLQYGHFELNGLNIPITNFTQAEINEGLVTFVDESGPHAPNYWIGLSDGRIELEPVLMQVSYNYPPRVEQLPQNQEVYVGESFDFRFSANTFTDTDPSDALTIEARLADDTNLPQGIIFEPSTLRFTGELEEVMRHDIQLVATDKGGLTAQAGFGLQVNERVVAEEKAWWQSILGPGLAVTALTTGAGFVWRRRKQGKYRSQYELADALRQELRLSLHDFSSGDGARFVDSVDDLVTKLSSKGLVPADMDVQQRAQLVSNIAKACREVEGVMRPGDCIGRQHNRQRINLTEFRNNLDVIATETQRRHTGMQPGSMAQSKSQPGSDVELQSSTVMEGVARSDLCNNPATLFGTPAGAQDTTVGEPSRSATPPPPPPMM